MKCYLAICEHKKTFTEKFDHPDFWSQLIHIQLSKLDYEKTKKYNNKNNWQFNWKSLKESSFDFKPFDSLYLSFEEGKSFRLSLTIGKLTSFILWAVKFFQLGKTIKRTFCHFKQHFS